MLQLFVAAVAMAAIDPGAGTAPGENHSISGQSATPANRDGTMKLTLLHAPGCGALCLDGSPGGYYSRPGLDQDKDKWLLVFQGGGWCYTAGDGTAAGSLKACAARAKNRSASNEFAQP